MGSSGCKSRILIEIKGSATIHTMRFLQTFIIASLPVASVSIQAQTTNMSNSIPSYQSVNNELCHHAYVKTNAVGWGMGIANIGFEADFTHHFSITLPLYYSGWNYFKSTIKFRTLALQPEVRYWLSELNNGFFAGAHFGMAYYNYASDGEFRYQDHNRRTPALGGGISAGYRMPISRDERWQVEFSVGAGIYSLHYDKFYNTQHTKDGLMIGDYKRTFYGIDQVSVSFMYRFDLDDKEGKR